jgi:ABC-type cobalamin transport system permease subunit
MIPCIIVVKDILTSATLKCKVTEYAFQNPVNLRILSVVYLAALGTLVVFSEVLTDAFRAVKLLALGTLLRIPNDAQTDDALETVVEFGGAPLGFNLDIDIRVVAQLDLLEEELDLGVVTLKISRLCFISHLIK